jgi:hypothetical protein
MRLWHLIFAVAGVSLVMTLAREPLTRVFLIVFATGVGEVALGLIGVMALFQTLGALGEAKKVVDGAEALAATSVVLAVATAAMSACLFAGFWLVWTFA